MRILIDNFQRWALMLGRKTVATIFCRLNSKSKLTCSSSTSFLLLIALYFQRGRGENLMKNSRLQLHNFCSRALN
jgi:hypothetical protein